eukprot:IDg13155t1
MLACRFAFARDVRGTTACDGRDERGDGEGATIFARRMPWLQRRETLGSLRSTPRRATSVAGTKAVQAVSMGVYFFWQGSVLVDGSGRACTGGTDIEIRYRRVVTSQ